MIESVRPWKGLLLTEGGFLRRAKQPPKQVWKWLERAERARLTWLFWDEGVGLLPGTASLVGDSAWAEEGLLSAHPPAGQREKWERAGWEAGHSLTSEMESASSLQCTLIFAWWLKWVMFHLIELDLFKVITALCMSCSLRSFKEVERHSMPFVGAWHLYFEKWNEHLDHFRYC